MTPELNYLPISAFFTDTAGQVISCNLKYIATLGGNSETYPQWLELVHPDDREGALAEWKKSCATKKPAQLSCRLIKLNHNIIWADIRLNPIFDESKTFVGFSGSLIDTTNQVVFDKVLERFKKAVEKTDSQIIFTDANGVVTFANAAIEKLTGYTLGEVVGSKAGKPWGGLMDKEIYGQMWHKIKTLKEPYEGDFINKKKSGETYYAHINVTPVLDARGEVEFFVGIERDITYLKEMDRVKTEFISLASHQLRTPLSSIKWLCELFWQDGIEKIPQEQKEIVQKVQAENERLIKLVNSLLNVSRIDANKLNFNPVLTEISGLLTKVVDDFRPKIKDKKQTVETDIPADLPKLMLDEKLAGEAFSNLLSNAHKYTLFDGRIWVKAKIDKKTNGKELIVSITDSGIGIPADDQHRIFEKFFRARNAQLSQTDGNGLGLYFVKWVMEQHGGRIWFESREGIGTTFYLAFPLAH